MALSQRLRTLVTGIFGASPKRTDLVASLDLDPDAFAGTYTSSNPSTDNRFKLAPDTSEAVYRAWPSLAELSASEEWSGLLENRKGALMAHDRATIEARMTRFCDPTIPFQVLKAEGTGPVADAARYDAETARSRSIQRGGLAAGRLEQIVLQPFNRMWTFYTDVRPIWNEPRPEVAAQQEAGNTFIVTRLQSRKADEGVPVMVTRDLPGYHSLDPNAHPLPVKLHRSAGGRGAGLALHSNEIDPNLSSRARTYLTELGLTDWLEPNHPNVDAVWFSALAIVYAPGWLDDNAESILDDWPRVPLPRSPEHLRASASLGRRIADL